MVGADRDWVDRECRPDGLRGCFGVTSAALSVMYP